ncbi:MAG TPA: PQQ-binding-like beta-propeller repeat protein [Bacteroidales bacterium]|nr:PQQ-binding-like beta-propeller repeat protein [Bacteroidales bacterium]
MLRIRIDNREVEVPQGATILEAAEAAGYYIPTLCNKKGVPHYSSCMVCLVKDKNKNSFIPSCSALAQDGQDIDISSDDVTAIRKKAVELLLSEHRAECEAPCRIVCPAGYNIPLMNRYLAAKDFDSAFRLVADEMGSGELNCLNCKAFCENACRRKKIDEPVTIRKTRLFIGGEIKRLGLVQETGVPATERIKGFSSRIGKLENDEQIEWLKECPDEVKRFKEPGSAEDASFEAAACMHCDCRALNDCSLRGLAEKMKIKDPSGKVVNAPISKKVNHQTGLIFENAKCIKCGLCVRVCEDSAEEPSLCFIQRGFVSIISEPLTASFQETLLSQSEKAVAVCPTGALKFKYFFVALCVTFFFSASAFSQSSTDWPVFRGKSDLSGNIDAPLPANPALLWSLPTGAPTRSSPVVSDGTVFFGNDKGTLIAVTSDGKIKWKYECGSMLEAAPLIFGNKVIVGTNEGVLNAVDKVSGKLIWSYKTDNQISGSANVWVSGNQAGIVVGSYDYYIHCIDVRTGKLMWKVETNNYVNGTPAILNNSIVFGGCDGIIRIVDPLTGREKDTIDIGVYIASSPALSGNFAYFGDYDGTKYCVNTATGKKVWTVAGGSGAILGIPAVGNNMMVIGTEDKYLYCHNSATGKLAWKFRTNGRIISSPVISKNKVLFTGTDGFATILSLADGKKLWSFNAGSSVSASPAVAGGRFYILTDDGRLLAFGNPPPSK